MKILAIETSCDETAIALVDAKGGLKNPQFRVIKNVVSSQVKIHRPFGGVVPSLAKREHLKNLPIVLRRAISSNSHGRESLRRFRKADLIAVTVGPGLEPALWTGINFAKTLASADSRRSTRRLARINLRESAVNPRGSARLIGVNHLEGHMYSFLLSQKTASTKSQVPNSKQVQNLKIQNIYPAIVLIVSGGHTILVHQKNLTTWKKIGETRDDAAGEAFDKVARMLNLPYPGGPALEKFALRPINKFRVAPSRVEGRQAQGKPEIEFPRPMIHQKNYDFSFSGLKTSVLYYLRDHKRVKRQDVAASFQQAIIDVLTQKTIRAANEYGVRSIILSGGVASNQALRKRLQTECRKNQLNFLAAEKKYQTDNAAMIAVAGYLNYLRKKSCRITAQAGLNL